MELGNPGVCRLSNIITVPEICLTQWCERKAVKQCWEWSPCDDLGSYRLLVLSSWIPFWSGNTKNVSVQPLKVVWVSPTGAILFVGFSYGDHNGCHDGMFATFLITFCPAEFCFHLCCDHQAPFILPFRPFYTSATQKIFETLVLSVSSSVT